MKTIQQYLTEKKVMAEHNILCYSKTYGMDTPKEGYEEQFAEAVRDCEIVEELIALVQAKETPSEQTSPCDCPFKNDVSKLFKLLKEIENYVSGGSPARVSQLPEMR